MEDDKDLCSLDKIIKQIMRLFVMKSHDVNMEFCVGS